MKNKSSSSLKNLCKLINTATKDIPQNEAFLADLQNSIERKDFLNKKQPSKTYKPSSMNCIRNMYFQVAGAPVEDTRNLHSLIDICESGSDAHERIQQHICDMKDLGFNCEYIDVETYINTHHIPDLEIVSKTNFETKLKNTKYNMSFLCDGIILYNNKYYILEIKTETQDKFFVRQDVDPSHYNQATAYSLCFGIDEVMFLYENRNTCLKKCFIYKVTQEMRNQLADLMLNCTSYLEQDKIPPKPENVPKKACAYCNYKSLCKANGG